MPTGNAALAATMMAAASALWWVGTAQGEQNGPEASAKESSAWTNPISAEEALQAMAGMAGYYRVAPNGDTYLYPSLKLVQGLGGLYGTYGIGSQGITLVPMGMAAPNLGMSAMGGVAGSFRVTPMGQAYFRPQPEPPVGMSGMSGPESDWRTREWGHAAGQEP